ncbi:tRNA epoxyqueuosine(34) reductase QueG [Gemmata sp. G18]|uniref:tRNA epoxyqueuosine(34) reductase QueG n=1 Tax=Gemmata palustris TaxID=2822762 RepID=A0ABS5C0G8_9BACT|nr:tRNA epoxyqueuosine(34) reductase QueG [Gemmata palustris]MBP3959477.1 tRNA epoxyqueuosine(34) reductase QueG [Gemmata palustris]
MNHQRSTQRDAPNTSLSDRLKEHARELGFALAGIAPATDADGFARFGAWLERGFAGEMSYLPKFRAERQNPRSILEGVRSVLMVGMEYGRGEEPTPLTPFPKKEGGTEPNTTDITQSATVLSPSPLRGGVGEGLQPSPLARVAAYAAGPDYHRFIWDRLNALAAWLEAEVPGCRTEAVADTAPLLERDFARRAGLGWVGKNTMLINTRRGSFFFLGAVLTDLELEPDSPSTSSHCGTCTACLDACPTQAFVEPFVLNATKCISYLTIELRSDIPVELREPVGNWLYGCDVCQDVCPWNRNAGNRSPAFPHDPDLAWLDPAELLGLDTDTFRVRFKKTSFWRNRRAGLLRNAAIVLGNVGDERALPALEKALTDSEDVIRDAARWAIERIHQRTSSVKSGLPSAPSD